MAKVQYFFTLLLASIFGGLMAIYAYHFFFQEARYESIEQRQNAHLAGYYQDSSYVKVPDGLNFIYAANIVRPAVVHIKATYLSKSSYYEHQDLTDEMFKPYHGDEFGSQGRQSTGSGVIIADNGYIVTNNHVIDNASKIEVILKSKQSFEASLIGVDPSTDLALLKINAKGLPFVKYGNSDKIQIGEWVLAIGNPFDLTSTVTAGIVSAKERNISLLRDKYAIESFIQTDAAVNPGNSGGALVNLKGELIGVNTAIATNTGVYAGYSFAIPITIVKKVMNDLMKYGETQRALLGVSVDDVDAVIAKEKNLKFVQGVLIREITDRGAASTGGLLIGDVITQINNKLVNSTADLQATIALYNPGDIVKITYFRKGTSKITQVVLKNKMGNVNIVHKVQKDKINVLGAEFLELSEAEKRRLGIKFGVKVISVGKGKIKESGMREGFIIMKIDSKSIFTAKEVMTILQEGQHKQKTIAIDGIYPNGTKSYFAIGGW